MKKDYRRISVFIHGWWGSGKSWLAASAPGPRLVLDTEGGSRDTPGDHILWDPRTPIPTKLTKDSTVRVDATCWDDIENVRDILRHSHPFQSFIVDSVHELQEMLKQTVATPGEAYNPDSVFDRQAWGRLRNHMGLFFREVRDLTRQGGQPPINVILVSGTDDEMIPNKPMLEGASRKIVVSFYDVVGYLRTAFDQHNKEVRVLQISPSATVVAKCRLHNLKVRYGHEIVNPTIPQMLHVVNTPQEKT